MPAEWEPHEATWIAWPHNRDDWPGKFAAIPWVYAEIVRHLHQSEMVRILVNGSSGERKAREVLEKLPLNWERIAFLPIRTNRVWTRDFLPTVVRGDDGHAGSGSNGVSMPGPSMPIGNAITPPLCAGAYIRPAPCYSPTFANGTQVVLEGGSIDVDGQGLLLTTEECLLGEVQQRNPGATRQDYEQVFAKYLGIRKVLWSGKGIAGDDTHGHIDDLARFVGPRTVVIVVEDNLAR